MSSNIDTVTETGASTQTEAVPPLTITAEGLVYAALALVVTLLRVLGLGEIPPTVPEIPRALAALQVVMPDAAPTITPDSALLQLAHMLSFSTFGITEAAARLPGALVGTLLVFSPVLFRSLLGRGRTLLMVVMLACSPVLFSAARLDSPRLWEMLVAVLALWTARQYVVVRGSYAVATIALLLVLALMTGPTGHVVMLTLVLSLFLAERLAAPAEDEDTPDFAPLSTWLGGLPWLRGLAAGAVGVLALSTVFMMYPAGFDALGRALEVGLRGWGATQPGAPAFYGMFASVFYEGVFWLFAVLAIALLVRSTVLPYVDAFFSAWLIVGGLLLLLYAGTDASHALWLTFPLVGLASGGVMALFQDEDGALWYDDGDRVNNLFGLSVPKWARWALAAIAAFIFSLILMHMGGFFRALRLATPTEGFRVLFDQVAPSLLIVLVLVTLLAFVGFSAASLYGGRVTLRGGALGLFIVGLWASLGTGWQITHARAEDPRELWHIQGAYGPEVFLLRDTLIELARRESGGFPQLAVTLVSDDPAPRSEGALAWVLRDFDNVTVVPSTDAARGRPIVIAPLTAEAPDLGGNYVGQTFHLRRGWSLETLSPRELPAWWFQRQTRVPPSPTVSVVLWLRQDIYAGVPFPGLDDPQN